MFVASSLFNYAKGSTQNTPSSDARVKRHAKRTAPHSPPPSYASVAAESIPSMDGEALKAGRSPAELEKMAVVDLVISEDDLYKVLGVKKTANSDEIRRGFLNRSRACHPDKLPSYPPCVVAFQKVSSAYQTLSKPSSRKMYDVSGRTDLASALNNHDPTSAAGQYGSEETLNGVLYSVFCEFLEGDFEMIRVLVNALNESNPGLDLGDEAVDSIEGAFKKLREMLLAGKKYLTIIRFELIRLYEIQHSLRQLSYFDVFGRLRLTLQLARVTLSIPMAIDQAMKGQEEDNKAETTSPHADSLHEEDNDSDASQEDNLGASREPEEFGIRADDENDSDGDTSPDDRPYTLPPRERRRQRRRQRRERIRAARRAKLEAQQAQQLQKRGLLGPTAAGLLKGVVHVLETSEGWVPGGAKAEAA